MNTKKIVLWVERIVIVFALLILGVSWYVIIETTDQNMGTFIGIAIVSILIFGMVLYVLAKTRKTNQILFESTLTNFIFPNKKFFLLAMTAVFILLAAVLVSIFTKENTWIVSLGFPLIAIFWFGLTIYFFFIGTKFIFISFPFSFAKFLFITKKLLPLSAIIIFIILSITFFMGGEKSNDPNLIYEKKEFPFLCEASGNYSDPFGEGVCYLPSGKTSLYISGKLVTEMGYGSPDSIKISEKQLSESQLEKVISEIRKSDILNKECPAGSLEEKRAHYNDINLDSFNKYLKKENLQIEDYSAEYYLNIDDIQKKSVFSGCLEELDKIDRLISYE